MKKWALGIVLVGGAVLLIRFFFFAPPYTQIQWGKIIGVPKEPGPDSVWSPPVPSSARELSRSEPGSMSDDGYRQVKRVYLTPMGHQQIEACYAPFEERLADAGWTLTVSDLVIKRDEDVGRSSRMWSRSEGTPIESLWTLLQLRGRVRPYSYRDSSYETFSWEYYTSNGNGSTDILPEDVGTAYWKAGWIKDSTAASWTARGNGILVLTYTGNVHLEPSFVVQ
jgi:hypothetical protein